MEDLHWKLVSNWQRIIIRRCNMYEYIRDFKLITFNTGHSERYLVKGNGQAQEFKSKKEALDFIECWYESTK